MRKITVAVAVLFDEQHRVLITQRANSVAEGGLWEFPGGKLEDGEPPHIALIREIKEEVSLTISRYQLIDDITHHYDTAIVTLLVYHVSTFHGVARCCENQQGLQWVEAAKLHLFSFPAANQRIVDWVKCFVEASMAESFLKDNGYPTNITD